MRNGRIVRQIDIDDFAVKTSICFKGLAPAGALVVVDRLDDVGRDRILHKRRERHQEVDGDVIPFERPRHVDDVVCPLRVPDED